MYLFIKYEINIIEKNKNRLNTNNNDNKRMLKKNIRFV